MLHAHKFALAPLLLCLFAEGVSAGMFLTGNDPFHISEGAKSQYNFSGAIRGQDSSGNTTFRGSVTLYDPIEGAGAQSPVIWAATAKHTILQDYNNPASLVTNIQATFESNKFNASVFYNVAEVFLHPTRDFAIFRFETPVLNVTPVELYRGSAGIGTEVTIVGNGFSVEVGGTNVQHTGDRRVGFDVVTLIDRTTVDGFHEYGSQFDRVGPNFRPFQLALMNGYSGGSALVDGQFLATNDSGSLRNDYGKISYYDKVPIDFSDSITAVPEPGSIVLLSIGSGLFLWRRLRRKAA